MSEIRLNKEIGAAEVSVWVTGESLEEISDLAHEIESRLEVIKND